ncbi:uncharacterized protein SCHCODRAFT_02005871 [Schizophyllum commune H4-8]|uniref:uncharacterized protein n=1 Tax=Schizophyllum commune (strain H4-8 / FGSC 9210) TaxID=578458 RepID=UPI00215ECDFC|nr:uncharacterized protein SCHCODRAFT_02005871 [Schizophyllum commune H4-8]KAI5899225.1 hypothetical protein SCHCODRAFT_02005871 [Schizophyllum commune H4-8]
MFAFQKSRSFGFGPCGITRGGEYKASYRGISRDSALDSCYGLLSCPISEVSVTWGVGRDSLQLSLSFKREVVVLLLLYLCATSLVFS